MVSSSLSSFLKIETSSMSSAAPTLPPTKVWKLGDLVHGTKRGRVGKCIISKLGDRVGAEVDLVPTDTLPLQWAAWQTADVKALCAQHPVSADGAAGSSTVGIGRGIGKADLHHPHCDITFGEACNCKRACTKRPRIQLKSRTTNPAEVQAGPVRVLWKLEATNPAEVQAGPVRGKSRLEAKNPAEVQAEPVRGKSRLEAKNPAEVQAGPVRGVCIVEGCKRFTFRSQGLIASMRYRLLDKAYGGEDVWHNLFCCPVCAHENSTGLEGRMTTTFSKHGRYCRE